jgi:FOG: Ankyrin repeat
VLKLLLDQPEVKTNEKDDGGWTALHYAAYHNNREGARMLLLHPTMDSANAKDNYGVTAVMWAVRRDHKDVLSELVSHESVSLDIGNVGEIER